MRLTWDEDGKRLYETGTKKGVVFPMTDGKYDAGVAWNGLTGVTKSPGGAEANDVYADDMKYLTLRSAETFGFTIECLQYPDEFAECNGEHEPVSGVKIGQQPRKAFGFAYRSVLGNDTQHEKFGYKLHLIYNSTCSPSEAAYSTVNESPETMTMSFEAESTAVKVDEDTSTCTVTIDSTQVDAAKLKAFEDILYGTDGSDPTYTVTEDTTMQAGKTYYEKDGDNYVVTSDTSFQVITSYVETTDSTMDSSKTYYEYDGTDYTVTTDTSFDSDKTYYEQVQTPKTYYEKSETEGTAARLPLPAEVIAFFQAG